MDRIHQAAAMDEALRVADRSGDHAEINRLIAAGVGAYIEKHRGYALFEWSVVRGLTETTKILVGAGDDINTMLPTAGQTPIQWASCHDNLSMVRLCISLGARLGGKDPPLQWACGMGHTNIARELIAAGAPLTSKGRIAGHSLFYVLTRAGKAPGSFKSKLTSYTHSGRWTPLQHACWSGRPEIVSELIDAGAPVQTVDMCGSTALHIACARGHLGSVQILLSKGADVDAVAAHNLTPLHCACLSGNVEVVKALLFAGADRFVQNKCGRRPSQLARDPDIQALFTPWSKSAV